MEPQKWFPWRGTTPVQITEMGSEKLFLWRTWGDLNFRDAATSGTNHRNVSAREFPIFRNFPWQLCSGGPKVGDRWGRPILRHHYRRQGFCGRETVWEAFWETTWARVIARQKFSRDSRDQPAPKYHTKGCSRSCVDSPGARTLVFAAFEPFSSCEFRASIARTPFCHEGETHPKKPPTQIKTQFAQTISGQFVQTAPPLPFKISRKQAERVCANCLRKLLLFGWVVFWVGCLPLILCDTLALSHGRQFSPCETTRSLAGPSGFFFLVP